MNEVETGLFTLLTGGTALTALLTDGTAGVYAYIAHRGASGNYVVYNLVGGGAEATFPNQFDTLVYSIKGISHYSMGSAGAIDAQLRALIHDQETTISVADHGVWWSEREDPFRYIEVTPEGDDVFHAGANYRIRLFES